MAAETNNLDNYINLEESASYLGVKSATVRSWIKTKGLPAYKIGKLWKFRRSDIDNWMAEKSVQANKPTKEEINHGE